MIHAVHSLLPSVPKTASSRIVVVGSVAGLTGVPYRTIYCSTKFALTGFANALRMELRDVHGNDAPAVCLVNFPEVAGTALNRGRMDMGADRPPAYFDPRSALSVDDACEECAEAICRGDREWGQPFKFRFLIPLYSIIPDVLDRIISKHVKASTLRDE